MKQNFMFSVVSPLSLRPLPLPNIRQFTVSNVCFPLTDLSCLCCNLQIGCIDSVQLLDSIIIFTVYSVHSMLPNSQLFS